jgi:hypothetical protein
MRNGEPPIDYGDDGLLPAADYYNKIFSFLAISHHDADLNHFKHTLGEALLHRPHAFVTPLEAPAGELLSDDGFGSLSSWEFDVIGSLLRD